MNLAHAEVLHERRQHQRVEHHVEAVEHPPEAAGHERAAAFGRARPATTRTAPTVLRCGHRLSSAVRPRPRTRPGRRRPPPARPRATSTRPTRPARGARTGFCIFIASRTTSGCPAATVSPAPHGHRHDQARHGRADGVGARRRGAAPARERVGQRGVRRRRRAAPRCLRRRCPAAARRPRARLGRSESSPRSRGAQEGLRLVELDPHEPDAVARRRLRHARQIGTRRRWRSSCSRPSCRGRPSARWACRRR